MIAFFILILIFFYIFIFPILVVKFGIDGYKTLQKPESERTWQETKEAQEWVEMLIALVISAIFTIWLL